MILRQPAWGQSHTQRIANKRKGEHSSLVDGKPSYSHSHCSPKTHAWTRDHQHDSLDFLRSLGFLSTVMFSPYSIPQALISLTCTLNQNSSKCHVLSYFRTFGRVIPSAWTFLLSSFQVAMTYSPDYFRETIKMPLIRPAPHCILLGCVHLSSAGLTALPDFCLMLLPKALKFPWHGAWASVFPAIPQHRAQFLARSKCSETYCWINEQLHHYTL